MIGESVAPSTPRTVEIQENTDLHNFQLHAILEALQQVIALLGKLPAARDHMSIWIYTTNPSVLQTIINPWVQGGQQVIRMIIQLVQELFKDQVVLRIGWVSKQQDSAGIPMAKAAAQWATRNGSPPNPPNWAASKVLYSIWRKTRSGTSDNLARPFWQAL